MNFLIQYALSFIGVPYKWGGENPISGFDCSGLVQELLKSVGMDPLGDQTAQGLYNAFSHCPKELGQGALCFYGESLSKITHVAFMIDSSRVIEAGGGGSKTNTKEDAALAGAFVRLRPFKHRKDFVGAVKPIYTF
jgi:cell wall-associated NlpC family hydrolase